LVNVSKPDHLQGALELLILQTLKREPNHGFGIALHIETTSGGSLNVEEGSLYPALHRLERDGWITGEWATTGNQRRARLYKLTAAGSRRLEETREKWTSINKGISKVLRHA